MHPVQARTSVSRGPRINIQPYTADWTCAVTAFNQRVRPANALFQLPESPAADWLPKDGRRGPYQEMFLAVEGDHVRGAYTFKHQQFRIGAKTVEVGMCRMPISEGIVDPRYAVIGARLVNDAVRRQPLLYALGIGSLNAVMTRLLLAMGWSLNRGVPFYFKVSHGFRFARELRYLRTTRLRRWLMDAAAYSGAGHAGAYLARATLTGKGDGRVRAETAGEFLSWADGIWEASQSRYTMIATRDAQILNRLYPPDDQRFIRLKILEGRQEIGWAVLLDTVMRENPYFGNMRVGSIVDCLAAPERAAAVIAVATRFLEHRRVHLMVSNQSHPAWCRGLRKAGYIRGPSNFYFVTSRCLTKFLAKVDQEGAGIHLNRGDGDGPIHL